MREDRFLYRGRRTNAISFPLGGIGTGCIGLAGNGRLIDWEIFNRPNKGSVNGFSHFAVKAERGGKVLDARVLNGDLHPPYSGGGTGVYGSFGFEVRREYLTGLPHFKETVFRGEYPLAALRFKSGKFPGRVGVTAFNPFIPLNDKDSGIPAAFFEIEVNNTTQKAIDYTIAGTVANPLPANNLNTFGRAGDLRLLHLTSDGPDPSSPEYGDVTLATDAARTSFQQYWFRGGWFDNLEVYWADFTAPGPLKNRRYPVSATPKTSGRPCDHGTVAAHLRVAAGKTGRVRFVIAWNFPHCENYWNQEACGCGDEAKPRPTWKNYYATIWKNSKVSARYAMRNWDRLHRATRLFKDTLFASDLPPAALEAVSANISLLKTPTVMRVEDGTFYGWEGCQQTVGCCEGSCTHVWNYAQALPFLFPKLERSMRDANYRYNQRPDGGMAFRIQLPLGSGCWTFRPCADGQFGDVLKTYRDWKACGDTAWLRRLWPAVKRSIEFAWSPDNEDQWDPDRLGVLTGRQHHTLDMELFGPNSWLTGFYLGALKAGADMAETLGESETAAEYREIFERGKAWTDEQLFNGDYYVQCIDLGDRSQVFRFNDGTVSLMGDQSVLENYWSSEHRQIKYQLGEGSALDQIVAQWHANLYGLGEIFDPGQSVRALRSIFKYNFRRSMREHANPCRIYSLDDEAGLVICAWPEGRRKPAIPVPYAQETMHGFEYAAAILMIQNGLVKEGMAAVTAVRDHYDGEKRNPWNEIECGNNYARSMASYALLNAFSGFQFNLAAGEIGFAPVQTRKGRFRCFWSLDPAWGAFVREPNGVELHVASGRLKLRTLRLPFACGRKLKAGALGNKRVPCVLEEDGTLRFKRLVQLNEGQTLRVDLVRR